MGIAVIITDRNSDHLCQLLQSSLPDVMVHQWPDISDPKSIKLAVLWAHPSGVTDGMSNLEMVVSMGAGMDHINADVKIPHHIKRARIVTQALKKNMAQYVLQHILNDHRQQSGYQIQQTQQYWQVLENGQKVPVVGFLGLGEIGGFVADRCADLGYGVMAWTARQKHQVYPCFHGKKGLKHVCENSQYLVVLLPLNEKTKNIISTTTLSWCHPDTILINVGRGGHVSEVDLLHALDEGLIKQAVLDVFNQEPLPRKHRFWTHEKVTLTPHSSSRSNDVETAEQIVSYYRKL